MASFSSSSELIISQEAVKTQEKKSFCTNTETGPWFPIPKPGFGHTLLYFRYTYGGIDLRARQSASEELYNADPEGK